MNKDIEHIKARIGNLENAAFKERQNEQVRIARSYRSTLIRQLIELFQVTANKSGYWPGEELSKSTMIFVISWPFVAHGIMSLANSLRRTKWSEKRSCWVRSVYSKRLKFKIYICVWQPVIFFAFLAKPYLTSIRDLFWITNISVNVGHTYRK